MKALRWLRCPHVHILGIYGDRINHTPKGRRLLCIDCGRYLDGPVTLATGGLVTGLPPSTFRGACMYPHPTETKETQ